HVAEIAAKDLEYVQNLEVRLEVQVRWVKTSEDWKRTVVLVGRCHYQQCLDELEALIVSCMFELTKVNLSQMG
ncbi:hypothetical protein BYT27DRAFT_7011232, partial [Phlegmacium glaucopus]